MKLEHDPRFYDLVARFLTALDAASLTVSEQRDVLGHTGSTVSWELHSDLKNFGSELALNWVRKLTLAEDRLKSETSTKAGRGNEEVEVQ